MNTNFSLLNPQGITFPQDLCPENDSSCGGYVLVHDTDSVSFSGSGNTCFPLSADVKLSAVSGNTLSILSDGLYSSGGSGGGGNIISVFGRTGVIVATNGDYNTSQVTENTNLYFTNARAIASLLTGFTSDAGTISATDSILSAIQKLNGNISGLVTGVSSFNTRTGAITLTSEDITGALDFTPYDSTNPSGYISTIAGIAASGELASTYPNPTLVNDAVTGKVLTGYVSGAGTISATDSILHAIQKLNGNIGALTTGVSSVFGRTGAVVAVSNDYTFAQIGSKPNTISGYGITDTITQVLTGYASGAGTISAADSILSAIQKLNGNIGSLVTGVSSVSNSDGTLTISPTTGAVVASLNLSQANSWNALQTFNASIKSSSISHPTGASLMSFPLGGAAITLTSGANGMTFNVPSHGNAITLDGSTGNIAFGYIITATNLAGTGNRMVIASSSGVLSTQAIPTVPVTSVFGRTGTVVAASNDYTFAQIGTKPTTISGYGITDTISQVLTGYTSGAGTISATDSILGAIQKLNGNDGLKAPLASPTFTGTVTLPAGTVINSVLTGYASGAGTISSSDSILQAIQKLNGNIAAIPSSLLLFTTQTSNYTLALGDSLAGVEMNISSANTVTVPPNSSVAFPVGTQIIVFQLGTGVSTITAGVGVTLLGIALTTVAQNGVRTLIKRATNTWYVC